MENNLVTIIIPTKNSSHLLDQCLKKLRAQKYKNIEIIIVDGKSKDIQIVKKLVKKYNCQLMTFAPTVKKGLFDATKKRNYAAKKTHGTFIYHFDADMEITPNVIKDAVAACNKDLDAVIIPEDSFGIGVWAKAKNLERRFFWGDDTVESPRFFKRSIWEAVDGYDDQIAGGGDDRDIYRKLLEQGYNVGRIKSLVMHNEGNVTLWYLMKKQFMYKREALKYIKKRPLVSIQSYFPIRKSHITNWHMFAKRPKDTFFFIIMKTAESFAGIYGILYSLVH